MIDRFGLLPDPTKNLFQQTQIKLKAEKLGIQKIEAGPKEAKIFFKENMPVDPMNLINLIQTKPDTYKLAGPNALKLQASMLNAEQRFENIHKLLELLH